MGGKTAGLQHARNFPPLAGAFLVKEHQGHSSIAMCPYSNEQDVQQLELLPGALTIYRLVFGQNRQEDLVNNLLGRVPGSGMGTLLNDSQIELSPL